MCITDRAKTETSALQHAAMLTLSQKLAIESLAEV